MKKGQTIFGTTATLPTRSDVVGVSASHQCGDGVYGASVTGLDGARNLAALPLSSTLFHGMMIQQMLEMTF
jgi:hypothetical protein